MKCNAKHTKGQPKDWKCPLCGKDHNYFYIYETVSDDCELLHVDDFVVCDFCGESWEGKELAKIMLTETKECPTCKGTGVV